MSKRVEEEVVVVVKVVVQSEGRGGNDGNTATQGWRRAGEERLAASGREREREGEGETSERRRERHTVHTVHTVREKGERICN